MGRLGAALALLLTIPQGAYACACCSEAGERINWTAPVEDYTRQVFSEFQPDQQTRVYMTACGEECVKGIRDPQESYPAAVDFSDAGLTIALGDDGGRIFAPYPPILNWFAVDPGSLVEHGELYSEMRMQVVLQASGTFSAADGAIAQLVIAGTSNACMLAGNYRRWSLGVDDGRAEFRLFGDIAPQY